MQKVSKREFERRYERSQKEIAGLKEWINKFAQEKQAVILVTACALREACPDHELFTSGFFKKEAVEAMDKRIQEKKDAAKSPERSGVLQQPAGSGAGSPGSSEPRIADERVGAVGQPAESGSK